MTSDLRLGKKETCETVGIGYNFDGEKWVRQKWGRNIKSKCEMRKGQPCGRMAQSSVLL